MLPLAHVGHYLWVFYLLPVVIVVAGIVRSALKERREREAERGAGEPGDGGSEDLG